MNTNPFSIIDEAGISQAEFADLCEVTRCTVNLWVNGRMKPHRYLQPRVDAAKVLLRDAIDAGRLPLNISRRSSIRREALMAAIEAATV
jgi:transcriptional regulator with XRE-family HTH domain